MPHLKQFLICGLLLTIYFLKSINATEPSPSQPPDNDDDDGNPTIDPDYRVQQPPPPPPPMDNVSLIIRRTDLNIKNKFNKLNVPLKISNNGRAEC